ncbi:MAG TPA: encapsulin-associated ferritin-like protein [Acidimicrobiales bacterium]|jgi:ferritin-like protein|nr:encapsulin-associated ferritin-like protein [Acidimicrobiales bacterium]
MANSEGLHENEALLRPETIDRHRAFTSLQEELEAADWYDQRVDATEDAELGAILAHNRDEEKEHAMMLLEWLRRHDPTLDGHMRTYLFTDGPITGIEADAEGRGGGGEREGAAPGSLGLGGAKP